MCIRDSDTMKKRHKAEEIIRILRDVKSSDVKSDAIKRLLRCLRDLFVAPVPL